MFFTVDRTIGIGHVLTSFSFLISAFGIGFELTKQQGTRELQQANEVRTAAAQALQSLERWRDISMSFFDEIQPLLVETSEQLVKSHNKIETRDFLYKKALATHLDVIRQIRNEKLSVSYSELYRFNSAIKQYFETITNGAARIDEDMIQGFLSATQGDVLKADAETANTAALGNKLRDTTNSARNRIEASFKAHFAPAEQYITRLISMPNANLLDQKNLLPPTSGN